MGDSNDEASADRHEVSGTVYGSVFQARSIGSVTLNVAAAQPCRIPRELPAQGRWFVNRVREQERVDELVRRAEARTAPAVIAFAGGRGMGKSATSARWAHSRIERFADGQLFVDLSQSRHGPGVAMDDIVGTLLQSLGVAQELLPSSLAQRVNLFRTVTADKRILVVVENAQNAAEVSPLVPSRAGSIVLVTTTAPVEGVLAWHDALDVVPLKPLGAAGVREFLTEALGDQRVGADPDSADELAEICDGLPLALTICANRLAARPDKSLRWLVELLRDQRQRLSGLAIADGPSVEAVFEEAHASLGPAAAEMYAALGLHPGVSFDTPAVAAISGHTPARASELLDELRQAHLLEERAQRFRFHDLLRVHAGDVADRSVDEGSRVESQRRLAEYFRDAVHMADRAITPERLRCFRYEDSPSLAHGSAAEALGWFEQERPNLIAMQRVAAERGWTDIVSQLAESLWPAFQAHKHVSESRLIYELGRGAANAGGFVDAEARLCQQLARVEMDDGNLDAAGALLARADELTADGRNEHLRASVVEFVGLLHFRRDEHELALDHFAESKASFEHQGNDRGVALQEYLAAAALLALDRPREAVRALQAAAARLEHERDGFTHGRVLIRLADAHSALGDRTLAVATLRLAISVLRAVDATYYEATACDRLLSFLPSEDPERAGLLIRRQTLHAELGGTALGALRSSRLDPC